MSTEERLDVQIRARDDGVSESFKKVEEELARLQKSVKGATDGLAPLNSTSKQVFETFDKSAGALSKAQNAFGHVTEAYAANEISGTRAKRVLDGILASMTNGAHKAHSGMTGLINESRVLFDEAVQGRSQMMVGSFARWLSLAVALNPAIAMTGIAIVGVAAAVGVATSHWLRMELAISSARDAAYAMGNAQDFVRESAEKSAEAMQQKYGLAAHEAANLRGQMEFVIGATKEQKEQFAELAVAIAKATGKEPKEAAAELVKVLNGGQKQLEEYLAKWQLLTPELQKYIAHAYAGGRQTEAFDAAIKVLSGRFGVFLSQIKQATAGLRAFLNLFSTASTLPFGKTIENVLGGLPSGGIKAFQPPLAKPGSTATTQDDRRAVELKKEYGASLERLQRAELALGDLQKMLARQNTEEGRKEIAVQIEKAREAKERAQAEMLMGPAIQLEKDLVAIRSKAAGSRAGAAAAEVKRIQEELRTVEMSARRRMRLEAQAASLKMTAARGAGTAIKASEAADLEEFRRNLAERARIAKEYYERYLKTLGANNPRTIEAYRRMIQLEREYAEQQQQINKIQMDSAQQRVQMELDLEEQRVTFARAQGVMSANEEITRLYQINQRKLDAMVQYLMQLRQLYRGNALEQARIDGQIEAARMNFLRQRARIEQQAAQQSMAIWQNAWQSFESSLGNAAMGLLTRQQTAGQAAMNIMQAVGGSILQSLIKMGTEWLITQIGLAEILGLVSKGQAAGKIINEAAVAGAAAVASTAAIPIIGPALAPAAGAAASAAAMSFMAGLVLPSAAGGWDVPADSLVKVHEKEMILPAHLADVVRNGGMGSPNISVHATITGGPLTGKQIVSLIDKELRNFNPKAQRFAS